MQVSVAWLADRSSALRIVGVGVGAAPLRCARFIATGLASRSLPIILLKQHLTRFYRFSRVCSFLALFRCLTTVARCRSASLSAPRFLMTHSRITKSATAIVVMDRQVQLWKFKVLINLLNEILELLVSFLATDNSIGALAKLCGQ